VRLRVDVVDRRGDVEAHAAAATLAMHPSSIDHQHDQ
jgi:hypothetical protein